MTDSVYLLGRIEIYIFYSLTILVGRLSGPMDLSLLSEGFIKFTSRATVAAMNNDSSLG